jgi:RimJ/RimL family protein N-acetyltransferase
MVRGMRRGNIVLRPTSVADLPQLMALWNDGRVMKWVGFPDGLGCDTAAMARWFERLQVTPHRHHFVVIDSVLGFCGEAYYAVDPVHRRAGLDIKLRPEARGGRRAAAALSTLIHLVFAKEADVHSVWTEPAENNLAARVLYWSLGLRPAARPPDMDPGPSYWSLERGNEVTA